MKWFSCLQNAIIYLITRINRIQDSSHVTQITLLFAILYRIPRMSKASHRGEVSALWVLFISCLSYHDSIIDNGWTHPFSKNQAM